jgi:hypothetical protein
VDGGRAVVIEGEHERVPAFGTGGDRVCDGVEGE